MIEKQLTRSDIYKIIDEEREYQDKMHPDTKHHAATSSMPAHLLIMEQYLLAARAGWVNYRGVATAEALDQLRKVVALGVRCMEFNGAVRRDEMIASEGVLT